MIKDKGEEATVAFIERVLAGDMPGTKHRKMADPTKTRMIQIEVDGIALSGKKWAEQLGYGVNFINTYYRKNGEDATVNFIRQNTKPWLIEKRKEAWVNWFVYPPVGSLIPIPALAAIYRTMVKRCYNPEHIAYHKYGAVGITVCQFWLDSPKQFGDWTMSHGYVPGSKVRRIDARKGYYPENCVVT